MLASITPLGERGRGRRWGVTAAAYGAGSAAGGTAAGSLAGLAGAALARVDLWGRSSAARSSVVIAVVLAAAALDATGLRLPSPRRQVNEDWLVRYRGWVYGSGFGFQLGLGVVTIVPTAAVYATLGLAVLSGSVLTGATIGAVFGLVRSLPVLAVGRLREPAGLRRFHARMHDAARPADRATVALLCAVAAVAAVA